MHNLQPKYIKMKASEIAELLKKYNATISQLPKIKSTDASLPEGSKPGEVIRIERKNEDLTHTYFRVVV